MRSSLYPQTKTINSFASPMSRQYQFLSLEESIKLIKVVSPLYSYMLTDKRLIEGHTEYRKHLSFGSYKKKCCVYSFL